MAKKPFVLSGEFLTEIIRNKFWSENITYEQINALFEDLELFNPHTIKEVVWGFKRIAGDSACGFKVLTDDPMKPINLRNIHISA